MNSDEMVTDLRDKLTHILCEIDLMNICDIPNEYEPEAQDIAERIVLKKEVLSPQLLKQVFEKWFMVGCCTDEEYDIAYQVITKGLADPSLNARQMYQGLVESSE